MALNWHSFFLNSDFFFCDWTKKIKLLHSINLKYLNATATNRQTFNHLARLHPLLLDHFHPTCSSTWIFGLAALRCPSPPQHACSSPEAAAFGDAPSNVHPPPTAHLAHRSHDPKFIQVCLIKYAIILTEFNVSIMAYYCKYIQHAILKSKYLPFC